MLAYPKGRHQVQAIATNMAHCNPAGMTDFSGCGIVVEFGGISSASSVKPLTPKGCTIEKDILPLKPSGWFILATVVWHCDGRGGNDESINE